MAGHNLPPQEDWEFQDHVWQSRVSKDDAMAAAPLLEASAEDGFFGRAGLVGQKGHGWWIFLGKDHQKSDLKIVESIL
jgi:hypothetical protein